MAGEIPGRQAEDPLNAEIPAPSIGDRQQAAFYQAIVELDPRLAGWYYGALVALSVPHNPEVFVHAAHSVRELMDNLHKVMDVPVKAEGGNQLGDVFNTMESRWERGKRKSKCFVDERWTGEIDEPARRAFASVEEAITWRRENRPRRRDTIRSIIRGLTVSKRAVPSWVEDKYVELWDELRSYFIGVCHHGRETDEEEFLGALGALERFVLGQMTSRTFDQQDVLASIVRQVEGG